MERLRRVRGIRALHDEVGLAPAVDAADGVTIAEGRQAEAANRMYRDGGGVPKLEGVGGVVW